MNHLSARSVFTPVVLAGGCSMLVRRVHQWVYQPLATAPPAPNYAAMRPCALRPHAARLRGRRQRRTFWRRNLRNLVAVALIMAGTTLLASAFSFSLFRG
ncbi:hypothetical protein [Hymenobacter guriensis]|uniref:Uncharacterized protein n=1 Tax=Hymenobacter guriensis TaxID=2793065 RepID=A0ABS0L898_9BACT|nr:hypothetical protein [Hymenobacter guriensis]MBG8556309.1 hypothetical protein [Hymenobacter guriensis]